MLRRVAPHSRYVTVVTDLGGIHPSWLHRQNDAVYLPTERAIAVALRRGLSRERLHALGLPVRADFARAPADRAETRRAFGLDPDLPVILVMGGGGGIGPIAAIAEATSRRFAPAGRDTPPRRSPWSAPAMPGSRPNWTRLGGRSRSRRWASSTA